MRLKLIVWICGLGGTIGAGLGAADPDPTVLVRQLDSASRAEQEAAATALVALGPAALPALRAGRDGPNPLVQDHAATLVRQIEGQQLIEPTLLHLNFADQPMRVVLGDLRTQTGCTFDIYELKTDWLAQRITVQTRSPISFWAAVDQVCAAGQFQYNVNSSPGGAGIRFFKDDHSGPGADFKAFRVQIESIAHNGRARQLHLGQDDSSRPILREQDRAQSAIHFRVMVEPRLQVRLDGALTDVVIEDDTGQSLVAPPAPVEPRPADEPEDDDAIRPDFGLWALGTVSLKPTDRPGRVLRRFRGVAPVTVTARRPNPTVIPLGDAIGRAVSSEDSIVTVQTVKKVVPDVKITVVLPDDPDRAEPGGEATEITLKVQARPRRSGPTTPDDLSEAQFEVIDAAGKVWKPSPWWLGGGGPVLKDGVIRVRLVPTDENLQPFRGDITQAKLRYYDMIVVPVRVPFEFANIRLP